MMNKFTLAVLFGLAGTIAFAQKDREVGGPCEECDLLFKAMPTKLSWETSIAPSEPGEPLVIEGVIYQSDGKTPAPGVILYVYHTDAKGYYSNGPGQPETRHGHLRGWVQTDVKGRYRFTTIRPAAYPSGKDPAHIHPIIKEQGLSRYYIDEYLFEDDPLVTADVRKRQELRGSSGITKLTKENGVWKGRRDIVLGKNVPNY